MELLSYVKLQMQQTSSVSCHIMSTSCTVITASFWGAKSAGIGSILTFKWHILCPISLAVFLSPASFPKTDGKLWNLIKRTRIHQPCNSLSNAARGKATLLSLRRLKMKRLFAFLRPPVETQRVYVPVKLLMSGSVLDIENVLWKLPTITISVLRAIGWKIRRNVWNTECCNSRSGPSAYLRGL